MHRVFFFFLFLILISMITWGFKGMFFMLAARGWWTTKQTGKARNNLSGGFAVFYGTATLNLRIIMLHLHLSVSFYRQKGFSKEALRCGEIYLDAGLGEYLVNLWKIWTKKKKNEELRKKIIGKKKKPYLYIGKPSHEVAESLFSSGAPFAI